MSEKLRGEVVLVTGGSGFLGRHIVKHLFLDDDSTREIRVLDKIPYNENLLLVYSRGGGYRGNKSPERTSTGQTAAKPVLTIEADLCNKEECRDALRGVDVVLHCAALVSYDFPPDVEALNRNNVAATKNLLELCVEENVPRFVNCSSTEVTLQPCMRGGIIAMVVYDQESRALPPDEESRLIFGDYAASKLRAEKLALQADGTTLKNGDGVLRTVSLRPPLLYGEGDRKFVWWILETAKSRGNSLVKIAGLGGKQEAAYVGNAAWAFICAKKVLSLSPDRISGYPVFISDDTTVENLFRFCERLSRKSEHHINLRGWIPIPISYGLAWLAELAIIYLPLLIVGRKKFPISPRSLIAYLGSMILHNRTRAAIHLNYSPLYDRGAALRLSWNYYSQIFE